MLDRLLAVITLGVFVSLVGVSAQAHILERTIEWIVNDMGEISEPSCDVELLPINDVDDIIDYVVGKAYDDLELELCSTDSTGSSCQSVPLTGMNSEYVALAEEVVDADEVYLQLTERGTEELSFAENVIRGLRQQWHDHWCGSGDCQIEDALKGPDGTPIVFYHPGYRNGTYLPYPPLRSAERAGIAECLLEGYSVTQRFERKDYLISGPLNVPKLILWADSCSDNLEENANTIAEREQPSTLEFCALFWNTEVPNDFLGDAWGAFSCDPSKNPRAADGSYHDFTGFQVRYWADRHSGEFPGFMCPAPESSSSKYSTNGLRSKRTVYGHQIRETLSDTPLDVFESR